MNLEYSANQENLNLFLASLLISGVTVAPLFIWGVFFQGLVGFRKQQIITKSANKNPTNP